MADEKRFTLRMDSELFDLVKERAEKNKRSIAKEIQFLLEKEMEDENQDD